jgi:hypothetical protein
MNPLFPPNSRYHGLETATLKMADGRQIVYLRRRFVPPSSRFSLLEEHVAQEGDRLDNLAARYFGDPLLFWRICDANDAVRPRDLVAEFGRRLRITLPQGIPGAGDAER